jgi:hypothetical protein
VKIGSVESKKGLLFFITALSFGFKWSVERKLLKAIGTAQRNKANDCSETFLIALQIFIIEIIFSYSAFNSVMLESFQEL